MANLLGINGSIEELMSLVRESVNYFLSENPSLLDFKVKAHEQAMSHRIAVYLERRVVGLTVDCEYNKHLDGEKELMMEGDRYKNCNCRVCRNRKPKKNAREEIHFRPDIIVHKRGNNSQNCIVMEIKKSEFCLFDEAKLVVLTTGKYHYKLGVFVWFPKKKPEYRFYVDGQPIK